MMSRSKLRPDRKSRRPEAEKQPSPSSPHKRRTFVTAGAGIGIVALLAGGILFSGLWTPDSASRLAVTPDHASPISTRPTGQPGSAIIPSGNPSEPPPPPPSGSPPHAVATTGPDAGYIGGTTSCAECHASIVESYSKVAMGRSLYPPSSDNSPEDYTTNTIYHHEPSRQYFQMVREGEKFYQDRWQKGPRGEKINELRVSVDYVLGSGTHARSYIHMEKGGAAYQLPVAWYPQPGKWAMNPGYDNATHSGFSRRITYDCAYCHAAAPKLPAGADFANYPETSIFPHGLEAIDCERCHGPAAKHVELARAGASPDQINASIVNPGNLSNKLQLDVCMSCHLETTSDKLPHAIIAEGKPIYGFKPGMNLDEFAIHLDHPKGLGYDDKFEIAGQAYRMRMSKCFTESEGRMTCTTCHDPHKVPTNRVAAGIASCMTCHTDTSCKETPDVRALELNNCLTCHMPRRRTEDVVNVVMTDHFIQRHKPDRDLVAPLKEGRTLYKGEVDLYYPKELDESLKKLYLGIAQVYNGGDLQRGVALLNDYLKTTPNSFSALMAREIAMKGMGRIDEAVADLKKVIALKPHHPQAWMALGDAYERQARTTDAVYCYEQAIKLNPNIAPAHNKLGANRLLLNDLAGAIAACEKAAAIDPFDDSIQLNLASARGQRGEIAAATAHARKALAINPSRATGWTLLARGLLNDRGPTATADAVWYAAEGVRVGPGHGEAFEALRDAVDALPPLRQISGLESFASDIPVAVGILQARAHVHQGTAAKAGELLTAMADKATQLSNAAALNAAGETATAVARQDLAVRFFRRALELEEENVAARMGLAMALARRDAAGEAEALKLLTSVPGTNPDPQLINALAFLRATVRSPQLRDGRMAEETARRLVTALGPDPFIFDTLAAAQAEQGRHAEAVATLGHAIDMARAENMQGIVDLLTSRLPVYQSGKPLRQGEGPLK